MTKKTGVIGSPIEHSLSPRIHNYWIEKYLVRGTYEAIEVSPEDLGEFVGKLHRNDFVGVNVTIPHKETVMQYLDDIHMDAAAIGAVNTIVIEDGKTYGYNTDAQGFITNIQETCPDLDLFEKKVVMLGAGGASRAACVALLEEGAKITLINRTKERAEALKNHLVKELSETFPEVAKEDAVTVIDWEKRESALSGAALLANTTSLGMKEKDDLQIDISSLDKEAVVVDIVYNPLETDLLKRARQQGNQTVDGLGMLLYQAEPGFYAWFGVRPEVNDELREYVAKGMGG